MANKNGIELASDRDSASLPIPNGKLTVPDDERLPDYTGGANKKNEVDSYHIVFHCP